MWAKRFPVPEFDRYPLKNLDWTPPAIAEGLIRNGFGCSAIDAGQTYYEKFNFHGEHLLAVACKLPGQPVKISGNSFAWPIHRVVITDSLNTDACNLLADWTTPRPMNTRLGPDDGISITTGEVYVLIGHKFAQHWVGNRIMLDSDWCGESGNGFRILSSSETEINDFHDAIVYFDWA